MQVKRKAIDEPECPPSKIMRDEVAGLDDSVLSQLPERVNIAKAIRRVRRKELPPNPCSLAELGELPEAYKKTESGEQFLIYDSKGDDNFTCNGRVLVFSTRNNLQCLSRSLTWFVDGTFKSSPTLFTQLFTIIGTTTQPHRREDSTVIGLPFVYALLSKKSTPFYEAVFKAVQSTAHNFGI